MRDGKEGSITRLCLEDVEVLVKNFSFPWETENKTKEKWNRYFEEHQKKTRIVAIVKETLNNEIVGYGSLIYKSDYPYFVNLPEISDIWIHKNHRGKGFGAALIDWFEALASAQGYKEIGIGVGLYADYGQAQKLYVKLGYIPDGNGVTYQYRKAKPGTSYPLDDDFILWMKKSLETSL